MAPQPLRQPGRSWAARTRSGRAQLSLARERQPDGRPANCRQISLPVWRVSCKDCARQAYGRPAGPAGQGHPLGLARRPFYLGPAGPSQLGRSGPSRGPFMLLKIEAGAQYQTSATFIVAPMSARVAPTRLRARAPSPTSLGKDSPVAPKACAPRMARARRRKLGPIYIEH